MNENSIHYRLQIWMLNFSITLSILFMFQCSEIECNVGRLFLCICMSDGLEVYMQSKNTLWVYINPYPANMENMVSS